MTIAQYAAMLTKRWWLITICCVAVGAGAFIGSKLMTPLYQASVLMQVIVSSGSNQADYNNLLASDQLVQTESTLVTSQAVLRAVASHYPGLSVSKLATRVSATPQSNTQLFQISVLDESPTRAAALANDIATTFIQQQEEAIQRDNQRSQQQLQQELTSTEQQISNLNNQISQIEHGSNDKQQLSVLQIRLTGLQDHYTQVQQALVQLELSEAENSNILRIVQPAIVPTSPSQPRTLLNTGGGLVTGLLVGLLLALLLEQFDTRVRSAELLAQLLGYPVLASVWRLRPSEEKEIFNPGEHPGLIESYRILRTNIGFSAIDHPVSNLIVTSAMPGEGKSTIAANLAIFMAKAGKRTLLIDADMRRPTLHRFFGVSAGEAGLSSAIMAMSQSSTTPLITVSSTRRPTEQSQMLDGFIYTTHLPNLWLMPAGHLPPNPPELLDSQAMRNLLATIADYYFDIVIFDTPPLLGLSDTAILASRVDSALLVSDITRIRKEQIKQARAILQQTGVRIIGSVVNKQRFQRGSITPYYYQAFGEQEVFSLAPSALQAREAPSMRAEGLASARPGASTPPEAPALSPAASQSSSPTTARRLEPTTQVKRNTPAPAVRPQEGTASTSSPVPARPRPGQERPGTGGERMPAPSEAQALRRPGSDIAELGTVKMPSVESSNRQTETGQS
jgi:Mrp family chromosome partitioning ATPase